MYKKTLWKDHLIDPNTGEVLQQGTRFDQQKMNNIENGIYDAHVSLQELEDAKVKEFAITLVADQWIDKSYTIHNSLLTANTSGRLIMGVNSDQAFSLVKAARISKSAELSDGSLVISASGIVPNENINLILQIKSIASNEFIIDLPSDGGDADTLGHKEPAYFASKAEYLALVKRIETAEEEIAKKIGKDMSTQFFLPRLDWDENKQQIVLCNKYSATSNIVPMYMMPESNIIECSKAGISIVAQTDTTITFGCSNIPSDDVVVGISYQGEDGIWYETIEEFGEREITWYEKVWNKGISFLLNAEGDGNDRYSDKSYNKKTDMVIDTSVQIEQGLFGNCYIAPKDKGLFNKSLTKIAFNFSTESDGEPNFSLFNYGDWQYYVENGVLKHHRDYGNSYQTYPKYKENLKSECNTMFIYLYMPNSVYYSGYVYLNGVQVAQFGDLSSTFNFILKAGENTTLKVDEIISVSSWNKDEQANYVHELTDEQYAPFEMVEHKTIVEITEKMFLRHNIDGTIDKFVTNELIPQPYEDNGNTMYLLHGEELKNSAEIAGIGINSGNFRNIQISNDIKRLGQGSYYFNGKTSSIIVDDGCYYNETDKQFTIDFWAYIESPIKYSTLLSMHPYIGINNTALRLDLGIDGYLTLLDYKRNLNVKSQQPLQSNTWYHIALIKQQGNLNLELRINNETQGTIILYRDSSKGYETMNIIGLGHFRDYYNNYEGDTRNFFNGYIDEYRATDKTETEFNNLQKKKGWVRVE